MSFPIKNGGSFHSYVKLPEGKTHQMCSGVRDSFLSGNYVCHQLITQLPVWVTAFKDLVLALTAYMTDLDFCQGTSIISKAGSAKGHSSAADWV